MGESLTTGVPVLDGAVLAFTQQRESGGDGGVAGGQTVPDEQVGSKRKRTEAAAPAAKAPQLNISVQVRIRLALDIRLNRLEAGWL